MQTPYIPPKIWVRYPVYKFHQKNRVRFYIYPKQGFMNRHHGHMDRQMGWSDTWMEERTDTFTEIRVCI